MQHPPLSEQQRSLQHPQPSSMRMYTIVRLPKDHPLRQKQKRHWSQQDDEVLYAFSSVLPTVGRRVDLFAEDGGGPSPPWHEIARRVGCSALDCINRWTVLQVQQQQQQQQQQPRPVYDLKQQGPPPSLAAMSMLLNSRHQQQPQTTAVHSSPSLAELHSSMFGGSSSSHTQSLSAATGLIPDAKALTRNKTGDFAFLADTQSPGGLVGLGNGGSNVNEPTHGKPASILDVGSLKLSISPSASLTLSGNLSPPQIFASPPDTPLLSRNNTSERRQPSSSSLKLSASLMSRHRSNESPNEPPDTPPFALHRNQPLMQLYGLSNSSSPVAPGGADSITRSAMQDAMSQTRFLKMGTPRKSRESSEQDDGLP
jgi:hypothetical protein